MADDRTEKATPKRRQEARSKGQVEKSTDFNSALMLTFAISLLYIFSPSIVTKLKEVSIQIFTHLDPNLITRENFLEYLSPYVSLLFDVSLPFLLIITFFGVFINRIQIGHLFNIGILKPKFDKFKPSSMLNSLKNMFIPNPKNLVEFAKSFFKMCIVGGIAYKVIVDRKDELLNMLGAELPQVLQEISDIVFQMAMQVCMAVVILGILDRIFQHFQYEKSIKMTKQEIKDERKNVEGNPQIKSKIKSIQMRFAMQRMMGAIPSADVVVTNPTHYAVAIRYDTKLAPAPQVVAKGVDFVAHKIKEIAQNNNIPIVENKPLARTLYKIVPLDGLIPAELYVAVAEVLAYVYKLNRRK